MNLADHGADLDGSSATARTARTGAASSRRERTVVGTAFGAAFGAALLVACMASGADALARGGDTVTVATASPHPDAHAGPPTGMIAGPITGPDPAPSPPIARPSTALSFAPPTKTPLAEQPAPFPGPTRFERPRWGSFEHVDALSAAPDRRGTGRRFVVVIDPGHGGRDPGARAPNGLLEKELTLDIAHRVRRFMAEFGDIDVVLTREDDSSVSRRARVHAVRAIEADLFVSLHFNHLPQREVTLVESFYAGADNFAESRALQRSWGVQPQFLRLALEAPSDTTLTHGSERFARLVQRRVFDVVSRHATDAIDAGTKRDTLFMLTRSFTSGALVELTCLSNPGEARRLSESAYRVGLAAALVDAIRDYRASLQRSPLAGAGV